MLLIPNCLMKHFVVLEPQNPLTGEFYGHSSETWINGLEVLILCHGWLGGWVFLSR